MQANAFFNFMNTDWSEAHSSIPCFAAIPGLLSYLA